MSVKPIPDGYHTLNPYFLVADGAAFIEFLKKAFGAVEGYKMTSPDGAVRHAEMTVGDSKIMMGQVGGEWKVATCSLYFYVPDTDATYQSALEAGATSVMAPSDQFYGDRNAGVKDPEGNTWWIATHIEDVSPEEVSRRAAAHGKG
jgi:uncharacterized glyoxalase superfamily protein PhnB